MVAVPLRERCPSSAWFDSEAFLAFPSTKKYLLLVLEPKHNSILRCRIMIMVTRNAIRPEETVIVTHYCSDVMAYSLQ